MTVSKAGLAKLLGFNLDWFIDGIIGRNALGSAPYHAVILDLSLPGLDGLDLLRQWRLSGHDVPILNRPGFVGEFLVRELRLP